MNSSLLSVSSSSVHICTSFSPSYLSPHLPLYSPPSQHSHHHHTYLSKLICCCFVIVFALVCSLPSVPSSLPPSFPFIHLILSSQPFTLILSTHHIIILTCASKFYLLFLLSSRLLSLAHFLSSPPPSSSLLFLSHALLAFLSFIFSTPS